ncbi:MAG TPA: EscU/YscU/HrcU family type III secretion system export apparatus switch protein [Acidimicrobiia bacterium]|nr:EscU/YscU/HrcU family type III secretion system export apparatus switch protein [Acidimicrobiia bacterium]
MSGSDKTEQPTAKRKREARRDGNLARSPEVVAWAQMLAAGVLLPASYSLGWHSLRQVMTQVGTVITRPDVNASVDLLGSALRGGLLAIAPLALGMVAIGLIGNFAQTGFAVSGKALKPKFDRLSPKKGLKRLFSPHSAWEAGKAALKLLVLAGVAWPGVSHLGSALAGGGAVPTGQVLGRVASATMSLIRSTALAGLALAAVDYGFQRRRVRKSVMMTKQEVKEEYRQSEGDPMTRQRIRQRQVEMSRNRMMAAVAVSSVVVVNPTHIAVALEYRPEWGAPRVVAKGQGFIAQRIREEAEKHDVPIVRDVPLARTLHAACKLGQAIPADLYEAVARLLAFVFTLRRPAA